MRKVTMHRGRSALGITKNIYREDSDWGVDCLKFKTILLVLFSTTPGGLTVVCSNDDYRDSVISKSKISFTIHVLL